MDLENLIEFPTAAYTYYLFLKAFRIIQADRNKILNQQELQLFIIAFVELIPIVIIFFGINSLTVYSTVRMLRFLMEIFLFEMLVSSVFKEKEELIKKAKKFLIILTIFIWIYLNIQDNEYYYNCLTPQWVLVSGIQLIISALNAQLTFQFITKLSQPQENEDELLENNFQLRIISPEEKIKKKNAFTYLMVIFFLSSFIHFFHDFKAHKNAVLIQDCINSVESSGFLDSLFLLCLDISSTYLPSLIVYFVIFHQNIHYFNVVQKDVQDQRLSIFLDKRSEFDQFSEAPTKN